MDFIDNFLRQASEIAELISREEVARVVDVLSDVKDSGGRIFFLGVGGSAGNASHAVNDFRKLAGIECYAPSDNVSELTARANDEGWATIFSGYLNVSRLSEHDCLFIFSVGGGDVQKNVSPNLVEAIKFAKERGSKVVGVIGREEGYTRQEATASVLIPTVDEQLVTPHSEAFQAIIWHLIVSHPKLKQNQTKWESLAC